MTAVGLPSVGSIPRSLQRANLLGVQIGWLLLLGADLVLAAALFFLAPATFFDVPAAFFAIGYPSDLPVPVTASRPCTFLGCCRRPTLLQAGARRYPCPFQHDMSLTWEIRCASQTAVA